MKTLVNIAFLLVIISIGCTTSKIKSVDNKEVIQTVNDTVRIANDTLEYEIIIIDPGFNSWLAGTAKPRKFYSQNYFEVRNRIWVMEWNMRAQQPTRFNPNLYEMQIDYQNNIDYGYEVNYMLFNYLTYFQIKNNVKLGGFGARI